MSLSGYQNTTKPQWLQPLAGHSEKNSPWLLAHDSTPALVAKGNVCQRVSIYDFLHTLSGIVNNIKSKGSNEMLPIWTSTCGTYSVMWHKEQSNTSRLFVQKADDYYARIELHVNDVMRIAFQEPVWPHLQNESIKSEYLSIPCKCFAELEADGIMPDSANSANHDHAYQAAANS